LLSIIPFTPVDAFAKGDILQVLLLAVLFGWAAVNLSGQIPLIRQGLQQTASVLFAVIAYIMRLAPVGAFAAMAFTVGKFGMATLLPLAQLMGCFYLTCALFIFGVLKAIAWKVGFSLLKFLAYIKDELMIVVGTSSSESVLPRLMNKLERLGCSPSVVGLVVPAGYSFNLDGTSIYLTMAAVFVAQATDTPLSWTDELTLFAVLLLTSKGAAGVSGSGFVTLAATLAAVPSIPVAGLALILGIDRFMSEARALTNLIGNGVATLVIARWEAKLADEVLREELGMAKAV
jgi:aerobic C4-dicarboxylate transport protein